MVENFNWTGYISKLEDYPPMRVKWCRQLVEITEPLIKDKGYKTILEVGCSNGGWIRLFCKLHNLKGFGLDTCAFGNHNGFKFKEGDARNIPYADNSFDIVISLGLAEHFNKEERIKVLKEQVRVLAEGGLLICQVPNFHTVYGVRAKIKRDWIDGCHMWTANNCGKILKSLGMMHVFDGWQGVFPPFKIFDNFGKLFTSERLFIFRKPK
jgi:SAM-dependent methyltransferase